MSNDNLRDALAYDEADELANAVQDALSDHVQKYPGTSAQMIARDAYDVIMEQLGHGEDDDS